MSFSFLINDFFLIYVLKSGALDFSFIADFDLHFVCHLVTTIIHTLWAPNLEYSYLARSKKGGEASCL